MGDRSPAFWVGFTAVIAASATQKPRARPGATLVTMPDEDAGAGSGDDACWLDRVCDACGAFLERSHTHECRQPAAEREAPPA